MVLLLTYTLPSCNPRLLRVDHSYHAVVLHARAFRHSLRATSHL